MSRRSRGWGRGLRRAVGAWYNAQRPRDLAYQAIKYQGREGWRHADLLRLAHPTPATPAHDAIYKWIVEAELVGESRTGDRRPLRQSGRLRAGQDGDRDAAEVARLVRDERLPREAVPTEFLTAPAVWEALLERDADTAHACATWRPCRGSGCWSTGREATRTVVERLADGERLRRARVHPIAVLAALKVYAQGHGERGKGQWQPVAAVVDALDAAFYAAFGNVPATGKRLRLALDVSGSMDGSIVAGLPFLTAREASAAMALVTARVEPHHEFVAYSHELVPVSISPRQRLDDVVKSLRAIPMGGTFCHLPIKDALTGGKEIDAVLDLHGQRNLGRQRPLGLDPGARPLGRVAGRDQDGRRLPGRVPGEDRDPGQARRRRNVLERLLAGGPQRRGAARRRRVRRGRPGGDQ